MDNLYIPSRDLIIELDDSVEEDIIEKLKDNEISYIILDYESFNVSDQIADDKELLIDKSIAEAVYYFNKAGYKTVQSCAGHFRLYTSDENKIYVIAAVPYITFEISDKETEKINKLIKTFSDINRTSYKTDYVHKINLSFDVIDENNISIILKGENNHNIYGFLSNASDCWDKNNIEFMSYENMIIKCSNINLEQLFELKLIHDEYLNTVRDMFIHMAHTINVL